MLFALPLFIVLGIILPLLGWMSLRHIRGDSEGQDEPTSVRAIATQLAILQSIVACLGLLAASGTELRLTWLSTVTPVTLVASVIALTGFLALAIAEARRPLGAHEKLRAELRKISVKDPVWIGITLYAGAVEEFAYRGVLTLILASLIGYWPAAVGSAVLFGLGHLSGGWRAVGSSVAFALTMQTIVYLSGGLLLAVLVHAVYDLLAAWLGYRIGHQGPNGAATRRRV